MKNVQLVFVIIVICGAFSELGAQEKKWKMGFSYAVTSLDLDQKSGSVLSEETIKTSYVIPGIYVSRIVAPKVELGIGFGSTSLNYDLKVDKTIKNLDYRINFSENPDPTKLSYKLEKVKYNVQYRNIPIFAKIRLNKNSNSFFQPFIGLRIDNYFAKKTSVKYDFKRPSVSGGGVSIGEILLVLFFGPFGSINPDNDSSPPPEIDELKTSQREEINQFYTNQISNYFMTVSPSGGVDFQFKNVSFGAAHFFTFTPSKVNKLTSTKVGTGLRTNFSFRF